MVWQTNPPTEGNEMTIYKIRAALVVVLAALGMLGALLAGATRSPSRDRTAPPPPPPIHHYPGCLKWEPIVLKRG